MEMENAIKRRALDLGFDVEGIAAAEEMDEADRKRFARWAVEGLCGGMEYMKRNLEKRTDAGKLLDGAQSVICVGLNYKPRMQSEAVEGCGRVANYALYEDYHEFMKDRLRKLRDTIMDLAGPRPVATKLCVDSVPIAERYYAQQAGLGFIGRNHMLIHPELGPQVLLGEIVTDLPLQPDEPGQGSCEDCDKCIRACPTGALAVDGSFDARRCVSYLTIEHRGQIPSEFYSAITDQLFGCDRCVEACPYTTKAPQCKNDSLRIYPERQWLNLREILQWTPEDFEKVFKGSAVERTGLENLKRNAEVCLKDGGEG